MKRLSEDTFALIYSGSLAFILLSLGSSFLNSFSIVLLVVVTILGVSYKHLRFQFHLPFLLLNLLYIGYIIGYFISDNQQNAGKYLEYKLTLLLLPLLLSFARKEVIHLRIVFGGLLGGIVLFGGIGLINAFNCYQTTHNTLCFYSSSLSSEIHPSYMAAFVATTLVALIFGYKDKWFITHKYFVLVVIFLLFLYSLFLLSLAGLFFLSFLFIGVILYLLYQKFKTKGILIALLSISTFGGGLWLVLPTTIKKEFTGPISVVQEAFKSPQNYIESRQYPVSGSETRIMLWLMSVETVKEHPLGVGSGDLDAIFTSKFSQLGQREFAELQYNPHNQFLQIAIELGIPFMLLFIFLIVVVFRHALREKNSILFFLMINLTFNCLFESMLQRQYGLIFYVALICILYIAYPSNKIRNSTFPFQS